MREQESLYLQGGQPVPRDTDGPLPIQSGHPVPHHSRGRREPPAVYAHHTWAPQPGEPPAAGYRSGPQQENGGSMTAPPGHYAVGLSPSASWSSFDSAPPSSGYPQRRPTSAPKRSPRSSSRASLFDHDSDDNFKAGPPSPPAPPHSPAR